MSHQLPSNTGSLASTETAMDGNADGEALDSLFRLIEGRSLTSNSTAWSLIIAFIDREYGNGDQWIKIKPSTKWKAFSARYLSL